MQFTLNVNKCWKTKAVGGLAAVLFGSLAMPGAAFADSAFIGQVGSGMIGRAPMIGFSGSAPGNSSLPPELSSPKRGGADIAGALIIGNYNRTIQLQAGSRDRSAIGILGGRGDSVNLLQAGSGLQSSVLLLNTNGLHLNLLQPPGAAPFHLIIAHLPNGGWFVWN
jgi:hypothetical protein